MEKKATKKYSSSESIKKRREELKNITEDLQKGIKDVFESEKYKTYLDTMSKFPSYSYSNIMLIALQKPDASICQSFTGWKNMGRTIKLGEKGIKILTPCKKKKESEKELQKPKDPDEIEDPDADAEEHLLHSASTIYFKPVCTFDISQTKGKPLPTLGIDAVVGDVKNYKEIISCIKDISPVPVKFEDTHSDAKGYFSLTNNEIVVAPGMSGMQTLKTLIHEISHAMLHNSDAIKARKDKGEKPTKMNVEVEAESIAYTVCKHLGFDTSEYSFSYVAGWSSGKDMSELKDSLNLIQKTASKIINNLEEKMNEKFVSYSIYQIKDETGNIRFEDSYFLEKNNIAIEKDNYNKVYSGMIPKCTSVGATLESLYVKFNIDHPVDYKGHSLSVSDVVTLGSGDKETAHFVDSCGFKSVPSWGHEELSKVAAIKALGNKSEKNVAEKPLDKSKGER